MSFSFSPPPGTPPSLLHTPLCPLCTPLPSFLSFLSFSASIIILNIWPSWLVPPVGPCHWFLATFSEMRLVVTSARYKYKSSIRCRLSWNQIRQGECRHQAVSGSSETNQFATIKERNTTNQTHENKTWQTIK